MHAAQARRDRDELADAGDETAYEGGHVAFLAEIGFGTLQLLARQQTHVPQTRVGELIDD